MSQSINCRSWLDGRIWVRPYNVEAGVYLGYDESV